MLGYVCKYTPVELMEALGEELVKAEPKVTNYNLADTCMHPNVCSYAKAVLEDMDEKEYDGMILTTCCDSIRRLYDTLKKQYPDKFIYLLDVPRKVNDFSTGLFQKRIEKLVQDYEEYRQKKENIENKNEKK